MLSDQTLRYGEEMTGVLLGVDALCRAEQDAVAGVADDEGRMIEQGRESLVVLNMARGQRPETFAAYAEARQRLAELAAQAGELAEPDRRVYYGQLCHATAAFTRWREGQLPFRDQLRDFLAIPPEPVVEA